MKLHSIDIPNKKAIIEHKDELISIEWSEVDGTQWMNSLSCDMLDDKGICFAEPLNLIRNHLASAPKASTDQLEKAACEAVGDTGKQERYTNEEGKDLIDEWAETYPIEIFRVLMWEQMRKYHRRLGKKDDIAQEVGKIADYARRWHEVEQGR